MSNDKYIYDENWLVNYEKDGKRFYKYFMDVDFLKKIVDEGATDLRIFSVKSTLPFFIN